jgi:hypothetical protein
VKSEKCEFTPVNDHFEDKRNAEVEFQTLAIALSWQRNLYIESQGDIPEVML